MKPEKITRELVKIQSTQHQPEQLEETIEYVEQFFQSEEYILQMFEKEGKKSLLVTFKQTMKPEILLHGHLDVVTAEENQFEPKKEQGKLYGRGTADMKSGVACLIKTMQDLKEEKPDIGLLLTTDEEIGGFNGTGHLIDEGLKPGFVISAEPDDSGNFPSLVTEQKGVLQLRITAEGEPAHGSKPGKGENAAEKLMEKYREIDRLFEDGSFPTTVNLGKIRAGEEVNKVPEKAEMQLDIRYSEQYPAEEVLKDIKSIEGLDLEITARAPMMKNPEGEEHIERLRQSIKEISGEKPQKRKENFASDMRFFTSQDIPAVCYGPEGYDLHGENEYVELETLSTYIKSLKEFIRSETG